MDGRTVFAPLSGEEFFVSEKLLKGYAEAAESFFCEIADHFRAHSGEYFNRPAPPPLPFNCRCSILGSCGSSKLNAARFLAGIHPYHPGNGKSSTRRARNGLMGSDHQFPGF